MLLTNIDISGGYTIILKGIKNLTLIFCLCIMIFVNSVNSHRRRRYQNFITPNFSCSKITANHTVIREWTHFFQVYDTHMIYFFTI